MLCYSCGIEQPLFSEVYYALHGFLLGYMNLFSGNEYISLLSNSYGVSPVHHPYLSRGCVLREHTTKYNSTAEREHLTQTLYQSSQRGILHIKPPF